MIFKEDCSIMYNHGKCVCKSDTIPVMWLTTSSKSAVKCVLVLYTQPVRLTLIYTPSIGAVGRSLPAQILPPSSSPERLSFTHAHRPHAESPGAGGGH